MLYRLHRFSDHDLWPSDVSALVRELDSAAQSSSSSNLNPSDALSQLVEGDTGYTDSEKENLRLLPDAVLRFSGLLREIQQRRACGEEYCALTFTYQLAKIVGLCIHENASIIGQLHFVCPRGFPRSQGITTSLVSCVIRGSERHNDLDFAVSIEEDEQEEEDSDSSSLDDYVFFEHSSFENDGTPTPEQSFTLEDYGPWFPVDNPTKHAHEPPLRVCPEAHVIVSGSIRSIAVMPILPAADPENIIPLLSSVLYQRRVWGIDLPVVGISLTKDDTIVRVYVGWLDGHALNSVGLPLVHIVCPSMATPQTGAFDLSDATSAVAFARFILSLRYHFVHIKECVNNTLTPVPWQSEGRLSDDGALPHNGEDLRILDWAAQVPGSCETGNEGGDSNNPSSSTQSHNPEQPRGRSVAKRNERRGKSLGREPSVQRSDQRRKTPSRGRRASSQDPKPRGPSADSRSSSVPAPRSLSHMAKRQSKTAQSESLNTRSWQWARKVIALSTLGFDDDSKAFGDPYGTEVRRMGRVYEDFTEFVVPKQWIEPDPPKQTRKGKSSVPKFNIFDVVPNVFPRATRDTLCRQFNDTSPHLRKKALDDDLSEIVQDRLSHYLCASVSAYHRVLEATSGRDVNEAESRRDWDSLHTQGFVGPDDAVSPGNKMERFLSLPRSTLLDEYLDVKAAKGHSGEEVAAEVLSQYSTIAAHDEALCKAQSLKAAESLTEALSQKAPLIDQSKLRAIQRHSGVVSLAAAEQSSAIMKLRFQRNGLEAVLRYHAVEEADKAVCDTVLISQLPGETSEDQADISALQRYLQSTGSDFVLSSKSPPVSPPPDVPLPSERLQTYNAATDAQVKRMVCPASRTETDNDNVSGHKPEKGKEVLKSDALWIPRLVVENKKASDTSIARATNQCRIYCVSAVRFLAYLGIHRHVVFGVAADGPLCSILMAWTNEEGLTFLFDREVRQLNISLPIQALQYATFLLRLKRQADRDKAELTDRILEHYRTNKLTQSPRPWHKAAQIAEFKEFHTVTEEMLPVQDVQAENEPPQEGQATAAPEQDASPVA